MATASPLQDERRHLRRFPAAELEVQLRLGRTRLRRGETVEAADFTREGVAIITSRNLRIGQKVLVDLVLRLDRSEIHQHRLVAMVSNVRAEGDRHRYGLKFDYRANATMRALETQARLGRMEGILERIEKMKARHRSSADLVSEYSDRESNADADN
ncbi:MAG: PilZ domain-containing protein [Pseudomonadota bacterium]